MRTKGMTLMITKSDSEQRQIQLKQLIAGTRKTRVNRTVGMVYVNGQYAWVCYCFDWVQYEHYLYFDRQNGVVDTYTFETIMDLCEFLRNEL